MTQLNAAASFLNGQIRRMLGLAGEVATTVDSPTSLAMLLDAERKRPYGDWSIAAFGQEFDAVAGQDYHCGIFNPPGSTAIAIVEYFHVQTGNNRVVKIDYLNPQGVTPLDVTHNQLRFIPIGGEPVATCPILSFTQPNAVNLLNVIGVYDTNVAPTVTDYPVCEGTILLPGAVLGAYFSASANIEVTQSYRVRWLSPSPI